MAASAGPEIERLISLLAKLPGTTRADEYVVYSAHWDHIGVRDTPNDAGDAINNGAMGVGSYGAAGSIVDSIGSYHQPPDGNIRNGSANVLFFDGHVDLVHVSLTKEVVTPRRYKF